MKVFYPGVYLFPVARELDGTQQDIGVVKRPQQEIQQINVL
jgi:hypothetical protein